MVKGDMRVAALALVAPIVLGALHQSKLGGSETRPLDIDAFANQHADAFIRAWQAS
jgi:hypothetical protein